MTFYPADHDVACQAYAIICAVENFRDHEDITKLDFRILVQENGFKTEADMYLDENSHMMPDVCKCAVKNMVHVQTVYTNEGRDRAQALAQAYLDDGQISVQDYVLIVKWSEGR